MGERNLQLYLPVIHKTLERGGPGLDFCNSTSQAFLHSRFTRGAQEKPYTEASELLKAETQ